MDRRIFGGHLGNSAEMVTGPKRSRPGLVARAFPLLRAREWWEPKIVPAAAIFYGTASLAGRPGTALAWPFLQLLLSLAAGAIFVCLINDLSDREDDRSAGKLDRVGRSPLLSITLLIPTVAAGLAFLISFADRPFLFWTYAAGWLTFAAYSLPPLRLKAKSAAGLVCDAIGAHLVPAMLAVGLASGSSPIDAGLWLPSIAVWSMALGIRGIIAHQLADEVADRSVGLSSFVVRYGPHFSRQLVRRFLFPIELAGLGTILALSGSVLPVFALAGALLFLIGKVARFAVQPVLTGPAPRQTMVLGDYYIVFLPVAMLAVLVVEQPQAASLVLIHVTLFPAALFAVVRDLARLPQERLE